MNGHSHELEENFRQYINIFCTNYRPILLQVQGRALVGVQGGNPPEALKSLQSTLFEVVKKSTLLDTFSMSCISKSQKKSLKFITKSKHFQINAGQLHSFIKVIKFY